MAAVGFAARSEWRRHWPSLLALTLLVVLVGGVAFTAVLAGARRTKSAVAWFDCANNTTDLYIAMSEPGSSRGASERAVSWRPRPRRSTASRASSP